MTNTNKILIGIAAALGLSALFSKAKAETNSGGSGGSGGGSYTGGVADYAGGILSDSELQTAFNTVKNQGGYSTDFMNKIEAAYRLESAHFKSGQFNTSFSPGMVAFSSTFPYNWNSLQTWATERGYPSTEFTLSPPYTVGGQQYTYVKFPTFQKALDFFAWFIWNIRSGDVVKWFSLDTSTPEAQTYRDALNNITLRYTV